MPDAEKASLEEVRRVAELACLELTPDEEGRMCRDLNAILDYVAQLGELDTANVQPLAQVAELPGASDKIDAGNTSVLREDALRPCLPRDEVMSSAPETDSNFFKVPRVIER